jgi:tetratricopeptide (TPR) repeat protein
LGAGGDESGAMQAQMLADTIQATLDHVDLVTGSRQLHQALRTNPGSAALIELRGVLRERLGDAEGAHADLTGLGDFPLSSGGREALMRACLELDEDAEALRLAESLIDDEIDSAALRLGAATAADRLGARGNAQLHWKALSRLDRKNVEAALRVLQGVVEEGPEAETEWREELTYFAQHDAKLAEALVRHAAANSDSGLFAVAIDALARNDPAGAGDILLQFEDSPLVFAASGAVGRVLSFDGLPSRLIKAMREIGRAWGMQSIELAAQDRLEDAAALANASADALGDNMANKGQRAVAAAMLVRARELAREGQAQAVLDLCEAHDGIVMARPRLALELSRALQSLGREDDAADVARRATERFPDDLPVAVQAGRLLQRRDLAAAADIYRRASAIDPDRRFGDEISAFWSDFAQRAPEQADKHVAAGEFEPALGLLRIMADDGGDKHAAARQHDAICDALRDRIGSLRNEDQLQQRAQLLEVLLRERPDDPFALNEAASAAMDSGDFDSALGLWQRLSAADPENDNARSGMVRCRLLLRDADADAGQERAVSAA